MAPPTALTALTVGGVPTMGTPLPLFTGNWFFVDVTNGSDGNPGTANQPMQTLAAAYGQCRTGRNDVVAIIGDGSTTNTCRLTATFDWAKDATHLIGIAAPSQYSQRARIAPTSTATAFTPFMIFSGNGCFVYNVQIYAGFGTGTTSAICANITGSRNVFSNVQFAGMADTASAQSAGSRVLKFTGGSECTFYGCTIGLDTVTRTQANANIEFAKNASNVAATRNSFFDCTIPIMTSSATTLAVIADTAGDLDRTTQFERCSFINAVGSTSTTLDGLMTLAASTGGIIYLKDCSSVGATEWGTDATSRGQIYLDSGTVTAATSGIAVNPT